ncbi:MAG: hypothetical protein AB7W16_00340 [Candidatus Obscuribacterales bacterium]
MTLGSNFPEKLDLTVISVAKYVVSRPGDLIIWIKIFGKNLIQMIKKVLKMTFLIKIFGKNLIQQVNFERNAFPESHLEEVDG